MQEFFKNVERYPRYLISLTLGIFFAAFESIQPLFFKNTLTSFVTLGILVAGFAFLFFTLKAMLGLTTV